VVIAVHGELGTALELEEDEEVDEPADAVEPAARPADLAW
jgi:hypothetical protein